MATDVGADGAAFSLGRAEERPSADAAGDDASGPYPAELVCARRPDGGRDAYYSKAMRQFAGIELGDDRIPDETTFA